MALLDDIQEYLKGSFNYTNAAKQPQKYINPKVTVGEDLNTPYAGYAPNNDLNSIMLNPNRIHDQMGAVGTYLHELAHTAQPTSLRVLNGFMGTPGHQLDYVKDYPYYDQQTNNPPNIEKLASMRETQGMMPNGQSLWDHPIGQDVLRQLKEADARHRGHFTEQQMKRQIDDLMFPPQVPFTRYKR